MAASVGNMSALFKIPRVIDGHMVVDESAVYAVFKVTSRLNPITDSTDVLAGATGRLNQALDNLRAGEHVQIVVDCRRYDPSQDILTMNSRISDMAAPGFRSYYPVILQEALTNYCQQSFVPVLNYYIIFSYKPPRVRIEGGPELTLVQKAADVDRRANDFLMALTDGKIKAVALREKEIVELLDEALNPSRLAPLPTDAFMAAGATPGVTASRADLLLRSPVANPIPKPGRRFNHIQVGSALVQNTSFLRVPGAYIQQAMTSLILSQSAFRFSFHVDGLSQEKVKEFIQKKRSQAVGAVNVGQGKNTQGSEEQANEYDTLLRRASRKEVRFVKWSAYLTLFASDEAELQAKNAELTSIFGDLVPDEGVYRQVDYWLSGLPLGVDPANNVWWAETSLVAGLMPFFNFDSSSSEGGILKGFGPANQPVFWHAWSKDVINGNVFICGSPGSGKSFGINNDLNRLAPEAYDVSIIDKAKSYKFSCMAAGGDYVEWTMDGHHAVNVWDVIAFDKGLKIETEDFNDLDEGGVVKSEKIESILGLAEIFMAEREQSLPKIERSLLMEAVQNTYDRFLLFWEDVLAEKEARELAAKKKAPTWAVAHQPDRKDLIAESVPTFSELALVLEESIKDQPDHQYTRQRRDLLQKLKAATSGNLKGLVNKRTTLKSDSRMRVFDISSLPENAEIQGLAMQIITSWLMTHWRKNKARNIKQIAVLDEMYFFMLFKSGRTMLDNLSRRSRHLGLICMMATQQLDDVLLYPETPSILRNAPTKILYQQDKSVVEKLAGLLGLTDQEQHHLASLRTVKGQFSNCLWFYNDKHNILTVRADPASRWLNTTEPNYDIPRRDRALAQAGGDPWEAVRLLIAQQA